MYMPSCDPNLLPWTNRFTFGFGKGPYTVHRNCFLKRDMIDYIMDYTKQFFKTYKDVRKFYTLRIIDAHEMTGELTGEVIDPKVEELFTYLSDNGHLENTIIHLYSDHGDHVNPIAFKTESGLNERFNPFYVMMVPKYLDKMYGENLKSNTQRLTNAFDIFETNIEYLGYTRQFPYGESLMKTKLQASRNCNDINLFEVEKECKCYHNQ